jgi:enterochelin esterase family protein
LFFLALCCFKLIQLIGKNTCASSEKKIKVKRYIVSGGHTWMYCKQFPAVTLQETFQ